MNELGVLGSDIQLDFRIHNSRTVALAMQGTVEMSSLDGVIGLVGAARARACRRDGPQVPRAL